MQFSVSTPRAAIEVAFYLRSPPAVRTADKLGSEQRFDDVASPSEHACDSAYSTSALKKLQAGYTEVVCSHTAREY